MTWFDGGLFRCSVLLVELETAVGQGSSLRGQLPFHRVWQQASGEGWRANEAQIWFLPRFPFAHKWPESTGKCRRVCCKRDGAEIYPDLPQRSSSSNMALTQHHLSGL